MPRATRTSAEVRARMSPEVAATGHGIPQHGDERRIHLSTLAAHFDEVARPTVSHYAQRPAPANADGVRSVLPPLVKYILMIVIVLAAGKSKRRAPQ